MECSDLIEMMLIKKNIVKRSLTGNIFIFVKYNDKPIIKLAYKQMV